MSTKYSLVHPSPSFFTLSCVVALLITLNPKVCFCFNSSAILNHWGPAGATWYGTPHGAGSNGGACGYGGAVSRAPFSSMITAISSNLYRSGKECGACYLVKCTTHPSCSRKPVRVVITDSCPGGPFAAKLAHFDLSGTALGAMAKPGEEQHLRNVGVIQIRYARVECDYPGKRIAFHVDKGSNPSYMAILIEFEDGDGDLAGVGLMEESKSGACNEWRKMQQSWGAVWKLNAGAELKAPLSIRITSRYSKETLVAKDVIPVGWKPGATYRSLVNFL